MERLTEYRVPKGGMQRKYPCFSPNIIPDDNCPQSVFCEKAKQCNFVHISSRKCPYLQVIDRLAAYEDTGLEPGEVVAMKIVLLGRELAKITDVDGVSINRICELAQAEKDGRLVVLPCKTSQTIWVESCIRGRVTDIEAPDITWIIENTERFGKEIFLTREEAEAALKKREATNETD